MIVTVASQKGGVGKTTIAAYLAVGLAAGGAEVLLVDLDPQGHCGVALGLTRARGGIWGWLVKERPLCRLVVATGRERLLLLPSDKGTAMVGAFLDLEHGGSVPRDLLVRALDPAMRNGLDVAIFDTAPTVSTLQAAALSAADLVVVPAGCDRLSQYGLGATVETLGVLDSDAVVVVVPTFYDGRTGHSRGILAELREWSAGVLPPVHVATVVRDAAAAGKTVAEFRPGSRADQELAGVLAVVKGALNG